MIWRRLMDMSNLRVLLDKQHEYPCHYSFKFIIKNIDLDQLKRLVGEAEVKERPSKKGTYLGVTISKKVKSTDHILEIYQNVSIIEGLVSL